MNKIVFYNRVFDILKDVCGAHESLRADFVFHFTLQDTREYRFQGNLGFGGKYWRNDNRVTCYQEDATKERQAIMSEANARLDNLAAKAASEYKAPLPSFHSLLDKFDEEITIDEFINQEKKSLARFRSYWAEKNAIEPDKHPLSGEVWTERYYEFISQDVEEYVDSE